jgi:hypothetical protein
LAPPFDPHRAGFFVGDINGRKEMKLMGWSYRTDQGTFLIEQDFVAGSLVFRLSHEKDQAKSYLGLYLNPLIAAGSISEGQHDEKLGFAAASLNVPSAVEDWNGL